MSPILKAAASHNLVLESACSPVLVLSLSSILEAVACSSFILLLTFAYSSVRCFYLMKSRNQLSARPPVTSVWLNGAHWIQHPSLQHWIPWTIIFIKLSPSLAFMASLPSISLTALLVSFSVSSSWCGCFWYLSLAFLFLHRHSLSHLIHAPGSSCHGCEMPP